MRTHLVRSLMVTLTAAALTAARAEEPAPTRPAPSAAAVKDPVKLVDETQAKVIAILASKEFRDPAQKKAKREEVRQILLSVVDMNVIAALTLANYRSKFSEEQLQTFIENYKQLLFTTYIAHFEKYTNEKVVIEGSEPIAAGKVRVRTNTIGDTRKIPCDYSLMQEGDTWMMYDVHIEGVSLVMNYRSQFRELLVNRTVDQFIERLQDKVKQNEAKL